MSRGFYSVVQYCPDAFRAEAVNVGLVLLRIEPHTLRVRFTNDYHRVKKLFGISKGDVKDIKLSVHGLASRIEKSVEELKTEEITDHVEPMFKELGVRLIRPDAADAFAAEVEQTAH